MPVPLSSRHPFLSPTPVLWATVAAMCLSGCATTEPAAAPAPPTPSIASTPTPTPTPTPEPVHFTIGYAGDVLTHMPVLDSTNNGDITPLMEPFNPWTQGVDVALCGLEVPQSPPGWEVSGWPTFGMPPAVIQALPSAGWDGCATASNHSLDRGWEGIVTTLDAATAAGLGTAGTGRTQREAEAPQLYELTRNGRTVRVAQLSATYGTNGIPLPENAPWAVVPNDVTALAARAENARKEGADIVVLQLQWGAEYVSEPIPEQRALAEQLAATGQFDALFGNHVHVPQPIEKLTHGGHTTWVSYGSGNYLSNQTAECCAYLSPVGLFPVLDVTVPADGSEVRTTMTWTPVTTDTHGGHRLYSLTALADGDVPAGVSLSASEIAGRLSALTEVMGGETLLRREPYTPTGPEPRVVPRPH